MHRNYPFTVLLTIIIICVFPVTAESHLLWEVSEGDNKIYLLGSFHLMPRGSYPLADPVEEAFASARCLVVEVDVLHMDQLQIQVLVQELGFYGPENSLENKLTADLYAKAVDKGRKYGIPANQIDRFQPWYLEQVIAASMLERIGLKYAEGIEMHFLERAHAKDLDIIELETLEMQMELLAGFSQELQITSLTHTLEQDLEVMNKMVQKALADWQQGNLEGLEKFVFAGREENPEMEEFYWQIFEKRNYHMAEQIGKLLEEGCQALVIVGSGHMVGEYGLPVLLQEKGFLVEKQ